jgi:hypothetical protein
MSPLTSAEYRALKSRADRSRASRHVALNRVCREAGIGAYHGCVLHNALISADQGRPWRDTDTSALRRARRLERDIFAASRIVDRLVTRRGLIV